MHEFYQKLPMSDPYFDYEYRFMIAERRLESLIESSWEKGNRGNFVFEISFEEF